MKSFCQSKHYGKQGKKIVLIEDVDTLNDTIYDVIVSYIDEYKDNVMFIQTTYCIEKIKHRVVKQNLKKKTFCISGFYCPCRSSISEI